MDRAYRTKNEEQRERLKVLAGRLSADDLKKSMSNGWTVAMTFAHLAFWDLRQLAVVRIWKAEGVRPLGADAGTVNAAVAEFAANLAPHVAVELALRAAEEVDREVETVSAELAASICTAGFERTLNRWKHRASHCDRIEETVTAGRSSSPQALPRSFYMRRYHPDDHARAMALHVAAMQSVDAYKGKGHWDDDLGDIDRAYLRGGGEFLVALLEGEIVGMGGYRRLDKTTAEIKRMRVAPLQQRRGIGRRILDALLAEAKHGGYKRVVLETSEGQHGAHALYKSAGFRPVKQEVLEGFNVTWYERSL